jgi:hypothetical protein
MQIVTSARTTLVTVPVIVAEGPRADSFPSRLVCPRSHASDDKEHTRNPENERTTEYAHNVTTPQAFRLDSCHVGRTSTTALIAAACLGLVSAVGCTATAAPKPNAAAAQAPTKKTDPQINDAVEDMLLTDSALSNNPIDATTSEGIVTLTGTTDTLMAKERAAKLTETLRGVRGVVNTLFVHYSFLLLRGRGIVAGIRIGLSAAGGRLDLE